eukprot:TRINITY_DN7161_c0_g1_i1.p1 TRINITY_DN7161_c0_g1~~TRINITY_DN7161_c0_g1_i1.p1  ORF type:complete len:741 (+),score=150.32 TRINITY_DN7161_c0_g1_i1:56-2278(+)
MEDVVDPPGTSTSPLAAFTMLKFQSFSSAVMVTFWHDLSTRKLQQYKLDDSAVPLKASYAMGSHPGMPSRVTLTNESFNADVWSPPRYQYEVHGTLHNTNTVEAFKTLDRKPIFDSTVQTLWSDIISGAAVADPSLLNRFFLLSFADLKKYKYNYWFAFPALKTTSPITSSPVLPITDVYDAEAILSLRSSYEQMKPTTIPSASEEASTPSSSSLPGAFLVREEKDGASSHRFVLAPLSEWNTFWRDGETPFIGFADPCALPTNPGWPLRNLLALIRVHFKTERVRVLCYRQFRNSIDTSITFHVDIPALTSPSASIDLESPPPPPKSVGWEANKSGKLAPRTIDLSSTMDPAKLADTAVTLNLELMRWRLMPTVQLDTLAATRVLLLGAGTLGCNVARHLMAWGFRKVSLVDYGRVSFSNPVRQSLYTFDDCIGGGKPKAETAAAAMKRVFPGMDAVGHAMSIPMPGHPVPASEVEKVRADTANLEALIDEADVVFLLTDSRESRWLPSLLCANKGKLVINSALGFDTFVVMRHGIPPCALGVKGDEAKDDEEVSATSDDDGGDTTFSPDSGMSSQLGCYFCNDVVAPQDSLTDRTLDQMCTVTRPGVSLQASCIAVELLVALLHHPKRGHAAAENSKTLYEATDSSIGLVPHQVRGFLSHLTTTIVTGYAFNRCTACSELVINEYRKDGFEFLLHVFNDPHYLEKVTGLEDLQKGLDGNKVEWELGSDDDGGDGLDDF